MSTSSGDGEQQRPPTAARDRAGLADRVARGSEARRRTGTQSSTGSNGRASTVKKPMSRILSDGQQAEHRADEHRHQPPRPGPAAPAAGATASSPSTGMRRKAPG